MEKLRRHHQVVEEKLGWMELVGTNAANTRGEVNDDVGTSIREKPPDRGHVTQVVVGASWHKDLIAPEPSQPLAREDSPSCQCRLRLLSRHKRPSQTTTRNLPPGADRWPRLRRRRR
jgi:hypothetical protein